MMRSSGPGHLYDPLRDAGRDLAGKMVGEPAGKHVGTGIAFGIAALASLVVDLPPFFLASLTYILATIGGSIGTKYTEYAYDSALARRESKRQGRTRRELTAISHTPRHLSTVNEVKDAISLAIGKIESLASVGRRTLDEIQSCRNAVDENAAGSAREEPDLGSRAISAAHHDLGQYLVRLASAENALRNFRTTL